MRRDPEELGCVTLFQVNNDPVLQLNQKLYHSFVRDVKARGILTATVSPVEHVGFTLVHASSGRLLLILDARRSNAHFLSPPGVRDSDESKSPCPKVLMWNVREELRH